MDFKNNILSLAALVLTACASIGTPDGGPYDEDPPVLLKALPELNATNVTAKKIELAFDENIKLVNAFENVVVSPPQVQMPEIKYSGKHITVELFDSLKSNTTYSIDFGDAIVDNNEGNPYENFAYVFSTGSVVDTLAVSGTVLNAEDLEPIKGIVVGLHSSPDDSAFLSKPFERVSRTDSRGRFTIKGIAPGKYRIYALADANQNNFFDQKSERIAYLGHSIEPFASPAIRPDTIWRDSVTIDTVRYVNYTRFQPDDIVLRVFNEDLKQQYLVKSSRDEHRRFVLYFASRNEEMPGVEGLGFDSADAFFVENTVNRDTITYWIKDSALFCKDTISLRVTYMQPDSIGNMTEVADTLSLVPKRSWEAVLKQQKETYEREEKEFLRRAKRETDFDENNLPQYVPKTKVLPVRFTGSSAMDVNASCRFVFDEPLVLADTSALHLSVKSDTTWISIPFVVRRNENRIREYELFAEWRPEEVYLLTADSAAFKGMYGAVSDRFSQEMKFRSLDDYAVLYLNIPSVGNKAVVQLLAGSGKIVAEQRSEGNRCAFYFIKPGTYYLRIFMDENGNGKWDTGDFAAGIQPEKVYYYNHGLELRAMFEYTQDDWNINMPLNEQKPLEITKQKPAKERKKVNRNATRKFK